MIFEWDENKNDANKDNHGISFQYATQLFKAPFIIARSDKNREERYIAIGKVADTIISVVYTYRGDNIRIISARKASKNERRKFDDHFSE